MQSHHHSRRTYLLLSIMPCAIMLSAVLPGCHYMSQGQNVAGVKQYQQGNFQGAVQYFNQALSNSPNNPDAYYNLARVYHRQASESRRQDDYVQAERLYNQCLDRSPNHVDCHRALAVMLVEQNRSPEAFRLLERWAMREPALSSAKVELARLQQEQGQRHQARDTLIQALASNPYDARALAALGRMYEEDGDTNNAVASYQRSLQANPVQPELAQRVASIRGTLAAPGQFVNQYAQPGQYSQPGGTRTVSQPAAINSQRY